MNFQDAEIIAAAKSAYEQGTLNFGELPEGKLAWENLTAEWKENWMKIALAVIQTLHPKPRPQIVATRKV